MKSAREMVSPAVSAAQTRLVTTPHDLVSPSTQRRVAVTTPLEYVSPLVRRQRGITSPQVLQPRVQENNDDAERRERRRSTVRDLHIQQLCSPGTPSSDKRTDPLNGLSTTQLTEHYANCIKLSAENKINSKNAFRLHLIDYMSELIAKKEMTNFQVASSTLDASAKIYAGRVDAIHTETYKMLSGLGCGTDKNDNDNDDDNEEDGDGQEGGVKRKKKVRRGKTIETNLKNIGLNKFDLEFQVDPFFQKMSAAFDEGGTGGLLLTQLRCFDSMSQLAFDSSTVVSQGDSETRDDDVSDMSINLRDMKSLCAGVKLEALEVCPTFAQFEFSNWNQDGEDSIMSQLNKSASGRHAFDLDAEPEPIPEDPGDYDGGYDALDDDNDHGDGASEAGSMMMGEGTEARLVENTLESIRHGTVGTLMQVLAAEPSEYSYFSANLLETWAGPDHWKLRPRSKAEILAATREATAVDGEKKTRGKKEPFRVDFEAEVDVDSHLKKTRAATTVTKATLVKYSKSQTTLPKDLHYDGEKLFKMSLRPRLMVKRQKSVTDVDDGVETYNYNNANDVENFCPCPEVGLADDGDDDDGNLGGLEMTEGAGDFCLSQDMTQAGMTGGDSLLSHSVFTGDNLVSQPHKVAKLNIAYAKIAKKIDMKRLKTSMWQLLTKPCDEDKENCGAEEEGRKSLGSRMVGRHSFSAVVRDLHAVLPKQSANNLSVHIAFGCLLHLANEKMLTLQSNETLTDIQITQ